MGALLCVLLSGGCAQPFAPRLTLPSTFAADRGLLVFHSDFPLPAHHRLVEELAARRNDLSAQLGLPLSGEPIHVYLFENAEKFESFMRLYHPEFPPRRAFFLETDARLQVYAQWGDRMAEDLRHEVTHGYLHSAVSGIPLWLDEGLAEYAEAPRGRRGLNESHVEYLGAALQRREWRPDLARLESFGPTYDMTQADYAEAWAWVHWLMESRPELREALRAYFHDLARYGSSEPLSVRIGRLVPRPEQDLVEHVRRLTGTYNT